LETRAVADSSAAVVSEPPSWRRIALAAGWVLPAFLLLPAIDFFSPIASFHDPENYLGVHSFMEAFSCAVSVLIFGVGWYAARTERSAHMAVLSSAFLSVALLDFAHILSYPGMPSLVTLAGAEKAIDLWLAARYAEAVGLLLFILIPGAWRISTRSQYTVLAAFLAYTALVYWAVLAHPEVLPRTFLPGSGLTEFKVMAEYGVIALHLMTGAAMLLRARSSLDFPLPTLFAAVVLLVASELAVTLYASVHDVYNFLGHVYKVIAFALIYRAVFVRGVTEPYRKRVASERLYRRLTEQAADAIFKLDRHARILAANPRAEQLTGRPAERMLGASLADFLTGEEGGHLVGQIAALPAAGTDVIEAPLTRSDGSVVPVEISIGRLDEGGSLAIARDISERKRSDEAIRIRDIAFSSSIVPLAMADLDGKLSYVNRAFLEVWGYESEQEVIGRGVADFMEDRNDAREALRALREEGSWNKEFRGRRREGSTIVVQVTSSLVRGGGGNPVCLIGSFRDITGERAATEALQKNEELLRAAAEAAGVGIYDHDHLTDSIYWSPEQRANYGVGADQVITLAFFLERVHPDDRDRIGAAVRRAHDPGSDGRFDVEHRIIRRDGSVRWLITRGRTFFAGEGRMRHPTRTIGAVFDVTERVRAAEERSALEQQLRQAQKMEALGQLTGGVAHDFNNLLGVASVNLELLDERLPRDAQQHVLLDRALAAVDRGANLTRSLLAFSRKQPLSPVPLDANRLISETAELFRRPLGERIELVTVTPDGLWPCEADPTQLQAALLNLLVNARDAMPNGGKITLETANVRLDDDYAAKHAEVTPGLYVMIAVSDTGTGMPQEVIDHAFEPFFTTKPVGAGSGLGLSMVYGFARQSAGHVRIYSEVGKGSSIKMYLPRAAGAAVETVAKALQPEDLSARGETILLVEDDAEFRATIRTMLREAGYAVVEAASAEAALLHLRDATAPHLLLTDVVLPGAMNGVELRRAAAALHPRLATVFMSGYTENAVIHHGRLDAGVLLLQKPFRKLDLLVKIRRALTP
jgi:PAS domain S-box-containing protein